MTREPEPAGIAPPGRGPAPRGRRRLARPAILLIDLLIVLAVAAVAMALMSDGIRGNIGGLRFSVRTPERPLALAAVLLAVRWWFARGAGAFGSAPGSAGRLARRWLVPGLDRPVAATADDVRRARTFAAIGYGAIAALLLHTQLAHMTSVPDLGDPVFSMWRLGWVYLQLQGDPRPLFDANIFHPEPLTLTFSDAMLVPALIAAPFFAAGVAPAVTYNVLMIAGFLTSALATYLLVVRLTGSPRAAFVAGLFYGFHPYRFEHYSHLELQMTFWMPLALLALHLFLERPRVRYAVLAGLCLVGQLYSSMYYAVFFVLFVPVVVLTLVVLARVKVRPLIGGALVAGLLAAALAVPIARAYSAAQPIKGDREIGEIAHYSATPSDYLRPHPRSALYGGRLLAPLAGERALFPGFVVLMFVAGALIPPIGAVRAAYLAGGLIAFNLSLGVNGIGYETLLDLFSPLRGMRVPARSSIILGISLAVLAGFAVQRLLGRLRSERSRTIAFALIVAAFIIDVRPRLELGPVWPTPPSTYSAVAGREGVVLVELPFRAWAPGSGWIDALPQMYFSIWHGRPMVNGYSGFFPDSYEPLLNAVGYFPGPRALDMFRSRGATHVAVTCALTHDKPGCDGLLEKIDSSPAFRQVAASSWEGFPARLYELLPTRSSP